MQLITNLVDPVTLFLLVAVLIAIAAAVLVIRYKAQRDKRNVAVINKAIVDYFRKSGVEVSVNCVRLPNAKSFTAFIESEPMKRFRLSHIIEATLRDLLHNLYSQELNKVYWRFPIKKENTGAAASKDDDAKEDGDDYITEGLMNYRHLPKAEVMETSWETFEEVSTEGPEKQRPQ